MNIYTEPHRGFSYKYCLSTALNTQQIPSSVRMESNKFMHGSCFEPNRQSINISEHGCDTSIRNSRKSVQRFDALLTEASASAESLSKLHTLCKKVIRVALLAKCSTTDRRAWFILQMVTAGNGIFSMAVLVGLTVTMTGVADHFSNTLDMK